MSHQTNSPPNHPRRFHSLFSFFLGAFAIPSGWPPALIYLLIGGMAGGITWLWVEQSAAIGNGLLVFLSMAAFFAADRVLLASLPARGVSFAPWAEQFFALALPRAAAALAFGLRAKPLRRWKRPSFVSVIRCICKALPMRHACWSN